MRTHASNKPDNKMIKTKSSQEGNALWFILIVVALFGALTAALSRNTGTVNQAGNIEQSRVVASSILRYTTSIETAIQRMMMEGLSESDLDFSAIDSDYENANCTDDHCKVFKTRGGGIPYRSLPSVISENTEQDWVVSAQNRVYLAGCDDAHNGCTELLLIAPDVPQTLCLQINAMQGITNPNGAPPQMGSFLINEKYNGTYTSAINSYTLGGDNSSTKATEVQGRNAACIESSGKYYFYQLLLSR